MPPLAQPSYSADEYLRLESTADHKSEFLNGQILATVGGTRWHDFIAGAVYMGFRAQTKMRPCDVYSSDMRVKVAASGLYTYPDVSALCGEARVEELHGQSLLNPSVIVEVLSPSTEAYDRGEKFAQYQRLDSLREYILISQKEPRVEQYIRSGEFWTLRILEGLDQSLEIDTLGCTLAMADIYDRVEFPGPEERRLS